MTRQCVIVTSSGLCEYIVEEDPVYPYAAPSGYSLAPDNTGEVGDTWNGSVWVAGSSPPALPPEGDAFALGSSASLSLKANNTDFAQLTNGGQLIVSPLTSNNSIPVGIGLEAGLQVNQVGSQGSLSVLRYSNDALASYIVLGKGREATVKASDEDVAALQSGDYIGRLVWVGSTGAGAALSFIGESAQIAGIAAAAFSGTSTPGHLAFLTTAASSVTPTEHMRLSSDGYLGIGIAAPTAKLHVNNTASINALLIEDDTSPDSSPTVIDAAGRFVTGHTAAISGLAGSSGSSGTPQSQTIGTSAVSQTDSIWSFTANAVGPALYGFKSRNATAGSHTAVSSGDVALAIVGAVSDGSAFQRIGQINFEADAAAAASDTPGRLRVLLTPDGSATPAEVLRIDNTGAMYLGGVGASASKLNLLSGTSGGSGFSVGLSIETQVTSGSPVASDGTGVNFYCSSAAGHGELMGRLGFLWNDVTSGSEDADFVVQTEAAGASPAEVFRVSSTGQIVVTTGARVANGAVATTLTSVGPTGASTTVQGWLKIKVGGTDRYVPYW